MSVIHFQLIFVFGVRQRSNFILLCLDMQSSKYHFLKKLSFSLLSDLGTLAKDHLTIYARVYFQTLAYWSICLYASTSLITLNC